MIRKATALALLVLLGIAYAGPTPIKPGNIDTMSLYNVRAYGAKCDGTTDDTTAIQAALDAAGTAHGTVFVPPTTNGCVFTNLKLPPYIKLKGEHMWQSSLTRKAGSTGTAIREKTVGEGNPYGATGIWIEDLNVDGNSTTGDGIDIGNQTPAYQLSTLAGMRDVYVVRFTSGIGMKINSNASSFDYVWSNGNQDGFYIAGGGANIFHSIFAEANTRYQIRLADTSDKIFGVQIEDSSSSTNPCILVEASNNLIDGVYVAININKNEIVNDAVGANRNTFRDVTLYPNGHTWTHVIYDAVWSTGTGATDFNISSYTIGESTGVASWYINQTTGHTSKTAAELSTFYQLASTSDATVGGILDVNNNLAKFGGSSDGLAYISGDELDFHFADNSTQAGYINYHGYNNTLTQYRDLDIRDGRANQVALFQGSTKAATFYGAVTASTNLTITGDTVHNGNTTIGDASADALTVTATATFAPTATFTNGATGINGYSSTYFEFNDDWLERGSPTSTFHQPWQAEVNGTGAIGATPDNSGAAGRPGIQEIGTGSTATGRVSWITSKSAFVFQAGDTFAAQFVGGWPTLSTATEGYSVKIGFFDTTATTDQTDGCYVLYDERQSASAPTTGSRPAAGAHTLSCVCATNSVRTQYPMDGSTVSDESFTTVAATASALTWPSTGVFRFKIVVTGTTRAEFYVNNVKSCDINTHMPSGVARATGEGWSILKSVSAGVASLMDFDFTNIAFTLGSARS